MAELNQFEMPIDFWHGKDDYFTSDNLYDGSTGERIICSAESMKFKKKDDCFIRHNDWKSQYKYSCSKGIDIILETPEAIVAQEVKNLRLKPKPYGTVFVMKKVLPRFIDIPPNAIKVLVITYRELLTQTALKMLAKCHIHIFETRFFMTNEIYQKQNLKQLYSLSDSLSKFIKQITQPIVPAIVQPNKDGDLFEFTISNYKLCIDSVTDTVFTSNRLQQTQYDMVSNYNRAVTDDKSLIDNPKHEEWLKEQIDNLRKSSLYYGFKD
jgi:hypothetical protein